LILPLRRAHRSAFVALAIVLPALLASAWKVRRAPIRQDLSPEYLPGWVPDSSGVLFPRARADELVYWTTAPLAGLTALPQDAELVGTVRSGALDQEPPAGKHAIVYSLAQGRLLAARADE
jgi:hypothetical protein